MKNKLPAIISLFLLLCISCDSDDRSPSDFLAESDRGALIRSLDTQNNSISAETLDGSLEAFLEYTDNEQGQLLDRLDIYTTFSDQSADGDSSMAITQEVLIQSIEETAFEIGVNDFPTYQMTITAQEFLAATNTTMESIATGDTFTTRLELVLTDGRTFSFLESDQFGPGLATFLFSTPVN